MTFDLSKLKISTKSLIAFVLGLGSLMQIPAVSGPVIAFATQHPHVSAALGVLTGIIALLHQPAVQQILGYETTTEKATLGDMSTEKSVSKPVTLVLSTEVQPTAPCVNCGENPLTGKIVDNTPKSTT